MTEVTAEPVSGFELSQNERFFRYFQHEVTALQEQIDGLVSLAPTGGERSDATDHCLAGIARLSHEVQDASVYLPAYDQRTYGQAIKALQEKLTETKASFGPRQKFSFKTARKNPSAVSLNDAAELAAQRGRNVSGFRTPGSASEASSFSTTPAYVRTPPSPDNLVPALQPTLEASWPDEDDEPASPEEYQRVRRPTFSKVSEVQLTDHSKVHIIVPTSAAHATMPASITRIKQSVVDIAAATEHGRPFASLTIKNIRKSLLVCGGVSGPAHITDVKDSVIVVNCRQFRMHQCTDVTVFLACSSNPIIEDCNGIKVAPYPDVYVTSFSPVPSPNLATQVQDFNQPGSNSSPNWSMLSSSDADEIDRNVWRDIVSREPGSGGGIGSSVREILEAVGIVVKGSKKAAQ